MGEARGGSVEDANLGGGPSPPMGEAEERRANPAPRLGSCESGDEVHEGPCGVHVMRAGDELTRS